MSQEPCAPQRADELGLPSGVVVGPGGGDQHAGYLGLGLIDGDQYFGIGTSGVVATSSRTPVFDPSGLVDGVADLTGGYLPLVSTLNAARVGDVAARLLGTDLDGLTALALDAGDTQGPVLVPFLDGERKPDRPDARGTFVDITSHTTRAELARSFVEGPLLSLLSGRDSLRACGVELNARITAVGGGSRSPATRQLLADLSGEEVVTLDVEEATARGACVQAAAVATGADTGGLVDLAKRWQPAVPRRLDAAAHRSRRARAAGALGGGRRVAADRRRVCLVSRCAPPRPVARPIPRPARRLGVRSAGRIEGRCRPSPLGGGHSCARRRDGRDGGLARRVSMAELADIVGAVGPARVEVHLIGSAEFVDTKLLRILQLRPAKVFLPWDAFTERRADALRAVGSSAWIALWREWDGLDPSAPPWRATPDGLLVMLIEPGSQGPQRRSVAWMS